MSTSEQEEDEITEDDIIECISKNADTWKELSPDTDSLIDVKRLDPMFPGSLQTCSEVVSFLRSSINTHMMNRGTGHFRSVKNFMLLIHYYGMSSENRAAISHWVERNRGISELSEMTVPPFSSKRMLANYLGYLRSARWMENLRFFYRKFGSL